MAGGRIRRTIERLGADSEGNSWGREDFMRLTESENACGGMERAKETASQKHKTHETIVVGSWEGFGLPQVA